jgi:hypothetical protein
MFEPSVNQITSAYMGNPGALQAKVQQEQKGNPGLPADLRDLLALQDIQTQKDAYARQMAMTPPQPTVADQLIQAVKQPLPQPGQGMLQMPQGLPQGMPQGLPQGMAASMPPAQQPGLQQLPSNIGQHMSGGGIVAFADGQDVISERDQLRRMEASYDPAVTEALNNANTATNYISPEVLAAAQQSMARGVMLNPQQERAAEERRHEAQVGNRDTSQYDRLMAEYESRKKQLEGPKPGIDALMEYLGQVAATPRGKTWMESGSMAARAQNDMAAQRQAQQFELTKLGIDAAQKKADILYGDKEKLFGVGNAAYDRAFKTNFDAAKLVTSNAFEAEKLAKQMTDNELNRTSKEKIQELDRISAELIAKNRNITSMAVANAPGDKEKLLNKVQKLRSEGKTDEADALLRDYVSLGGSAGSGSERNQLRQLSDERTAYQNIINNVNGKFTPEEIAEAKVGMLEVTKDMAAIRNARKPKEEANAVPSPAANKAPPLPPGFVKQ